MNGRQACKHTRVQCKPDHNSHAPAAGGTQLAPHTAWIRHLPFSTPRAQLQMKLELFFDSQQAEVFVCPAKHNAHGNSGWALVLHHTPSNTAVSFTDTETALAGE